jgi:serpin B
MNIRPTVYPSFSTVTLMLGLLGLTGCSPGGGPGVSDLTRTVVSGNTGFALELYGQLRGTNGNLFFSPYSISECLAMTYAGARGSTEKQMAQVLRLGTNPVHAAFAELRNGLNRAQQRRGIELSAANGLWAQTNHPLLPAFVDLARQKCEAVVKQVDFRTQTEPAAREINAWVSGKTKGKIGAIIPAGLLGRDSKLVLVNAIYFKGTWKTKFDPKLTRDSDFHLDAEHSVKCPMMACSGRFRYGYHRGPPASCDVIELPYVGGDFSLIAILPLELEGLADLESKLTTENLATWLASLRETEVPVWLPKFRLETGFSLDETLSAMGMRDAFGGHADFSGIDGTDTLYISSVLHRAYVEINEEGTTAAAATANLVPMTNIPLIFRADHPFLFLIRDNRSGSILFLGRLVDPTK